jgi:7-cyano-7-deazaguanosine (preQ0) biosynthesis protein QueE
VRFGFCDGDKHGAWCNFCDTVYSWRKDKLSYEMLTASEIAQRLPPDPKWVVLTGGNPLIQPHIAELFRVLPPYTNFTVETQGTVWRAWLNHVAVKHIAISPKLASSGMRQTREQIASFVSRTRKPQRIAIKVVCFTSDDVDEAIDKFYGIIQNFVLQVGTHPEDTDADLLQRYREITAYTLAAYPDIDCRILPQVHVLLFGHRRGV